MQDETDFSKSPVSIGELRADKERQAGLWTPRECLIACLRDLDAGKISPSMLFIGFKQPMGGSTYHTRYYTAAVSRLELHGLIAALQFDMFHDAAVHL